MFFSGTFNIEKNVCWSSITCQAQHKVFGKLGINASYIFTIEYKWNLQFIITVAKNTTNGVFFFLANDHQRHGEEECVASVELLNEVLYLHQYQHVSNASARLFTLTLSKLSGQVEDARRPSLFSFLQISSPSVSRSTMKQVMPLYPCQSTIVYCKTIFNEGWDEAFLH